MRRSEEEGALLEALETEGRSRFFLLPEVWPIIARSSLKPRKDGNIYDLAEKQEKLEYNKYKMGSRKMRKTPGLLNS